MISDNQHSIYTYFSKVRICEICQWSLTSCRIFLRLDNRRSHSSLSEGYVSRNNHRYVVVLQDLTTQRFQSYQCKTKSSQETESAWNSSWSWPGNQKTFTLSISWSLTKSVKICRRIIVRRPLTAQSKKESISTVLWQSGLDEKSWTDSMECYCFQSAKYSRYLVWCWDIVWKTMVRTWDPGDDGAAGIHTQKRRRN